MTDYDNLINLMNNVSIKFDENYTVDNDIEIDITEMKPVVNISLNFSQLWSLFGEIPLIEPFKCKLKKYFWIIKGPNDSLFCILGYSSKLLTNEDWVIITNSNDSSINQAFLTHLSEAIDCYDKYYRPILENEIISNSSSHSDAQKIKKELKQVIQLLQDI